MTEPERKIDRQTVREKDNERKKIHAEEKTHKSEHEATETAAAAATTSTTHNNKSHENNTFPNESPFKIFVVSEKCALKK